MRKILKFARREYLSAVRTKGFFIGLVVAPALLSLGGFAVFLLKDRVDTSDKHVAVIDRSGVIAEALVKAASQRNKESIFDKESGEKVQPAYYFKEIEYNGQDPERQRLQLSDRIRDGELHAFMEVSPAVVHPGSDPESSAIRYYGKSAATDDLRNWASWPTNNQLRKLRLADAGVDETRVKDLFHWVNVVGLQLVAVNEETGDIEEARKATPIESLVVPIIIMMLLFFMIMMSVPGMLHAVMEEKTQRIAEVVLGSVKPFEFMAAKLIGGVAVSMTSAAVYVVAGVLSVHYMGYEHFVPMHVLPWFFVYMLLAVVMYGAISASLGATCAEAKDAQSLSFPAMLPALFPMFIYLPVAKEPLSDFAVWASLIPPFTPMLMTLRLGTPETIPLWQPIVGFVGVLMFTVFFVWAGGRIFRVAILIQGTPPKLSNIVRWAIKG